METGWEYLEVEEAAEKAGWALVEGAGGDEAAGDSSLVGSVRDRLF